MQTTLVILKPSAVLRGLSGEIMQRFERKGLQLCGLKMMQLNEELLDEHYAHLIDKPFFPRIKNAMMFSPVVVCAFRGLDAVQVVRQMSGVTNGRLAAAGTIRGDFAMSVQENIVHTSDTPKNAAEEIKRFFSPDELHDYRALCMEVLYANDEFQ